MGGAVELLEVVDELVLVLLEVVELLVVVEVVVG